MKIVITLTDTINRTYQGIIEVIAANIVKDLELAPNEDWREYVEQWTFDNITMEIKWDDEEN